MIAAQELTMRAGTSPHLRHEADGLLILAEWVGPPGEPSLRWTVLRSELGGYPSGARYLSGAHGLSLADAHALIDLFRASREPAASIVAVAAFHRQLLTALDWPSVIPRVAP